MRMLVVSLKAITPPVQSQYRPTGHVTSHEVNIFAAILRFGENSVVNSHWRKAGKIDTKTGESREAVRQQSREAMSQQSRYKP